MADEGLSNYEVENTGQQYTVRKLSDVGDHKSFYSLIDVLLEETGGIERGFDFGSTALAPSFIVDALAETLKALDWEIFLVGNRAFSYVKTIKFEGFGPLVNYRNDGNLSELLIGIRSVLELCNRLVGWRAAPSFEAWICDVPPKAAATDRSRLDLCDLAKPLIHFFQTSSRFPLPPEAVLRAIETAQDVSKEGIEVGWGWLALLFERLGATAIELIDPLVRRCLPALGMPRQPEPHEGNGFDKPRTSAELDALTFWQSGNLWSEGGRKIHKQGSPSSGSGPYSSLIRATIGHDATQHARSISSTDGRIYQIKRRSRIRDFYRRTSPALKVSDALTLDEFTAVYDAIAFANRQKIVFNASVTVAWFMLGECDADECHSLFEKFFRNIREWLRSASKGAFKPAWIYVNETKGADKRHSHLLFAIPKAMGNDFIKAVHRTLASVIAPRSWPVPKPNLEGTFVHCRVRAVPSSNNGRHITEDQWRLVRYMLKGADPEMEISKLSKGPAAVQEPVYLSDLVDWEYENPGPRWGRKRVGVSQWLGSSGRKSFADKHGGFTSLLSRQLETGRTDVGILYSDVYLDQAHDDFISPPGVELEARWPPITFLSL